jgi:hypothetical protein
MSGWETARRVAWIVSPVAGLVLEGAEKAANAINSASDKGVDALREEVAKQEIRLKFELQQAKIAQELAIAQRILDAEAVEIEEFYDRSGKGDFGARLDEGVASLELAAEGRSVTKRIYHFKGRHDTDATIIPRITESSGIGSDEP